jgi:hypothetical protein
MIQECSLWIVFFYAAIKATQKVPLKGRQKGHERVPHAIYNDSFSVARPCEWTHEQRRVSLTSDALQAEVVDRHLEVLPPVVSQCQCCVPRLWGQCDGGGGHEVWVVRERLVGLLRKEQAGGRGKARRKELLIFPLQHCLKCEWSNKNLQRLHVAKHASTAPIERIAIARAR